MELVGCPQRLGDLGMMRAWTFYLVTALVAAFVICVAVEEHRLDVQRARGAALAVQVANAQAERDTTRDLALQDARVAELVGDSLRIVERRVLQVVQSKDAVDEALGRERVARYAMQASLDSLRRTATSLSMSERNDSVRVASFHLRQRPFTADVRVRVPRAPDSATLALSVVLDSIPLDARVRCESGGVGERVAGLDVSAPTWVNVRLGRVEQAPEVCAAVTPLASGQRRLRFHPLMLTVGPSFTTGGRLSWAVTLGVGVGWL